MADFGEAIANSAQRINDEAIQAEGETREFLAGDSVIPVSGIPVYNPFKAEYAKGLRRAEEILRQDYDRAKGVK